jgi:hypothetical protein
MRAAVTLFALGACADPAIEMSLKLPTAPAGFDVSCVTSITTVAIGNNQGDEQTPPDVEGHCIDVAGMGSFDDVRSEMAGKFTLPLPSSGLLGLTVNGSMGRCDDVDFYESVFYGGAPARGDSVEIPIVASLSCNMQNKPISVHPIDMLALATTKACPVTTEGRVFAASYRPLMLGDDMPTMTFEFGNSASSQWQPAGMPGAGTTKVAVFAQAASASTCVAVGYESLTQNGGARCVEDALPTLCAPAGEIELPIMAMDFSYQSRDLTLVAKYGEPVFGAVWEVGAGATKIPVTGATVTLDDPNAGTVVYVERSITNTKLQQRVGAASTAGEAFFMVYTKGAPTTITVASPLHAPQKYKIASSADYPATLVAALTRR